MLSYSICYKLNFLQILNRNPASYKGRKKQNHKSDCPKSWADREAPWTAGHNAPWTAGPSREHYSGVKNIKAFWGKPYMCHHCYVAYMKSERNTCIGHCLVCTHPDCTNVENYLVFFVTNGVIPPWCLSQHKEKHLRYTEISQCFLICARNVLNAFFCMEFLCLQALTGTSVLQQNASCLLIRMQRITGVLYKLSLSSQEFLKIRNFPKPLCPQDALYGAITCAYIFIWLRLMSRYFRQT